ncbi:MAG: hypothetical protein V1918_04745 [Planctomycetota bacterium]
MREFLLLIRDYDAEEIELLCQKYKEQERLHPPQRRRRLRRKTTTIL